MKLLVLSRPNTEYSRTVEEYLHDVRNRYPDIRLNELSLDTREGAAMASLYDVMNYPAILALKEDGQLLQQWQGLPLPLINEISYFATL